MCVSNSKRACFARGARVLLNKEGTAPGFCLEIGRALAFFLPGVPREMKPMSESELVPRLPRPHALIQQVLLKTFGLPESAVNDQLAGIEAEHGVTLGYRAHFPEIEVK